MRIPDPKANTTTEAYLAYKAGYLEESELKPKLYEPYLHFDAWLAYWAGLTNTYPLDKNGDPEMLTDEEALVAYLSGVTDTYPEEIKDPYDVRIVGYLKHLASIRWPEPDYPVNNEEFYLSTMEPTHTSNSVPSSDIELDTAEGKIIDVEAYGDTTQTTYSGKNLMNGVFGQGTYFSLTSQTRIMTTQSPQLVSGQAYTVSITGLPSGVRWAVNLMATPIYPGSGGTLTYDSGWKTGTSFTFTPAGNYYFAIVMGMTKETDISPSDISGMTFQLEAGSTATDYEPFVGGTPAPNPSYPQPISVVTGENVVKVVGKNIFSGDYSQFDNQGGTGTIYNYFKLPTDGTYTLKLIAKNDISVQNPQKFLGFTRQGGESAAAVLWAWSGSFTATAGQEFIITNDVYSNYRMVSMYPKNQATLEWFMENFDIQLEQGSTATTYEAYTAQDYAINLTGKNLFNKATSTDGYRIDSNGEPYANASYFISDYIVVQPSTTYAYSRGAAGSGLATIAYYKSDKTFISRTMPTIASSDTSGTVTTPNGAYYARFCDVNEVLDSAQLELGSAATEYAAYSSLELAKIGTYQDRIYKSGSDWFIEKNVGKITYDGTEKWNVYSAGIVGGDYAYSTATKKFGFDSGNFVPKTNYMSDHATQMTYGELVGTIVHSGIASTQYATYFKVTSDIATTKEDFVTWITSHPTTVYYTLATPTITEITNQTLIDQLEALAGADTYNEKTYIKVTATEHNLPALLKVEAYKY